MRNVIKVEAKVVRFLSNAMFDDFESGDHATYDATELQILSPEHFRNRKLVIYHKSGMDTNSPWRDINRRLQFLMNEDDIKNDNLLFTGAVWDLCASLKERM